ncbi:MAG TPA: myo-inosose-2 dehydratase [Steroidobacteraceae bacterium]|nr:myo-inosose-2 dehydratase [Steroidobacteraceae bacterium]HNS27200.1 myo-inosose-2 dehydratase [Steroidobacteraceae bacterium]
MTIELGINPITWTNDDLPGLGADIPLETCLREARAAGYTGVELGRKFPRDARSLGPILAAHDLRLVSGWYSLRLLERDIDAEFAAMAAHLALLAALGSTVMVVCEVTGCIHGELGARLSRRPHMPPQRWAEFGDRLTRLARRMQDAGMRMAYHHHMGTVVQSGADVDALMKHTGEEVGLLLDTGHLTYAGENPARFATSYAARIVHVHCKDVRAEVLARARNRDASFLDAVLQGVFTVPGDGSVDFPAALGPLARAGYDGWLVVEAEQDPAVATPSVYAAKGHSYLARITSEIFDQGAAR